MVCPRSQFTPNTAAPIRAAALAMALAAATAAHAADNGLQRYSPGVGGSDMSSPIVPGWYGQVAIVSYHASKLKGNDGNAARGGTTVSGLPVSYQTDLHADARAALNRITYISTERLLGGNLGFTVMIPLVQRKADLSVSNFTLHPALAGSAGAITANVSAAANAQDSKATGLGDIELSPVIHWEIGDHQSASFAPTIVVPTGDYEATRRANPGYGNFFTFRPSFQYAFIGDGWDLAGRAVLSFNTRNKDNGYFSGHMFNFDWQAMAFVSEDVRVGLQGYFVRQLSADTQKLGGFSTARQAELGGYKAMVDGNKASVNAAGPAVAWIRNGGEFMLEGKLMREFNARNRTEGQAFWLTLSKPL
ncbi:transporter [uncultured Aquabacterium sp.]|uniref:SphA family protein n=1 Tax=Aquabacterium sp. TaxID=1872578 RepID=UPI0025E13E3D|nr:transporter [uncultured Aquabacterium sp.]